MIEKATPPRLFPIEVERSLYQADIIFNAYQGEQGLVSETNWALSAVSVW